MTLALAMIVKNEEHVIRRCLESVRPLVDAWIVVDTGSEDNTIQVVNDVMRGVPGRVVSRPWVNFAHNRNESIRLAGELAEHVLVIDADDVILPVPGFRMPPLTADSYELLVQYSELRYWRTHIFRPDKGFKYTGVVHELLGSPTAPASEKLEGIVYLCIGGGGRSADPAKYAKDALLLEEELRKHPDDARSAFYLAQSYRDSGQHEAAIAAYERRALMPGWEEETFVALFERAKLLAATGAPTDAVVAAHMRAFKCRPRRAEPLAYLARTLRERGEIEQAYPYALAAASITMPSDRLFVVAPVYEWMALDEAAVAAYWIGRYDDAAKMNAELLGRNLPPEQIPRIKKNLQFCFEKGNLK